MDGPEPLGVKGKDVEWEEGLVQQLLTALNGRPRAMTGGGSCEEVRCEGL